jgi:hypothetical protein
MLHIHWLRSPRTLHRKHETGPHAPTATLTEAEGVNSSRDLAADLKQLRHQDAPQTTSSQK